MPRWFPVALALLFLILVWVNLPRIASAGYRNLALHSLAIALAGNQPQQLAQAKAYTDQAITYDQRMEGMLFYRLGLAHQELGTVEEANSYYQRVTQATNIEANITADALFRIGVSLNEQGRSVEAAEYFRRVLEIEARQVPRKTAAYANIYLGTILGEERSDLILQRTYLEKAVMLYEDGFTMGRYLALIVDMRAQGGEEYLDQALEMAIIATKLQARNTWTALARCNVHLARQEWTEAIKWCERSRNLAPNNHHSHLWLGVAYSRADRWEEALVEFEKAASLTSDNAWPLSLAEKARQEIASD